LTGVPACERQPDGTYPEGTVHRLVMDRLREYTERMRDFGRREEREERSERTEAADPEPAGKH